MTLAAIYARFSSDAQREESIEIQTRACTELAEREGWSVCEVYADYAMTGTNDERPGFKRCLHDGEQGNYDVLLVYKGDRIARNVSIAQDFKKRLFAAGRRIFSVREGELTDTPDGFLVGGIGDLFAEYYSRNLSVLIKGGIQQNARNCKASGVRLYGYGVDDKDYFIENPDEAAVVREIFDLYCDGSTCKDIATVLNDRGTRNKRGNPWSVNGISRMLANRSFIGEYSYAGVTVPGGMPAIIDEETFELAQRIKAGKQAGKRRRIVNEYILSEKLCCLECGSTMHGTSGTSKQGKKYTYYHCRNRGCGSPRIPSDKLEEAVIETLEEFLGKSENIQVMVDDLMEYAQSLPDMTGEYVKEREEVKRQRDNLVASIAEGVPASSVRDALRNCESRLEELDRDISFNKWQRSELIDEEKVRRFVEAAIAKSQPGTKMAERMIQTYAAKIYADRECAIVIFDFTGSETEFELSELRSLKTQRTPDNRRLIEGSYGLSWWRMRDSNPLVKPSLNLLYLLVTHIDHAFSVLAPRK